MPVDAPWRALLAATVAAAACRSHRAPLPDADHSHDVPLVRAHAWRDRKALHAVEAPPPDRDPRHADLDGSGPGPGGGVVMIKSSLGGSNEARDGAVSVRLAADGIYRLARTDKTWTRIARSFPTPYHKALVLDGDRAYWVEPAAGAVLSVPIAGGPVSLVCKTSTPVYEDLAIHGDTLYLIDVHNGLRAADKRGGPRTFFGLVDAGAGVNRNGTEVTAADDGLHVVTSTVDLSGGQIAAGFESRLVSYPDGAGQPESDEDAGLLFPVYPGVKNTGRAFAEIADDVKAGKVVVTFAVVSDAAHADEGRGEADSDTYWLRDGFGPDAKSEIVVSAPPPDHDPNLRWPQVHIGISREHLPALFAP